MAVSLAESFEDSDGQIAKLFEQAKEDFEHETHKKLNVLRRFDTVDDFIEQIRKEKAAFGSFREHEHPNLFRHIRNALQPIQILAKVLAGPAGNVGLFNVFKHLQHPIAVFRSRRGRRVKHKIVCRSSRLRVRR